MKREQKSQVIDAIATQIAGSAAIYAVDYRGLSVSQAAALRKRLREADATFRIVKNTLTMLAAAKAGDEQVKELLEGPTAFTFVRGDPALAAKTLDRFSREQNVLDLRGGLLDGQLLDRDAVRQIARLPGRDQLNAQVAGLIAAPVSGLVRGLGALLSGIAVALGQVREMQGTQPPSPDAEPTTDAAPASEGETEQAAEPTEDAAAPTGEEQQPEQDSEQDSKPEAEEEKEAE